jgi:hypothetical protein
MRPFWRRVPLRAAVVDAGSAVPLVMPAFASSLLAMERSDDGSCLQQTT